VQNCCKGRSNNYRKWHFWGFCRPETPQPINMKFGMDNYVRDTTRHPKWHVSRIRGVTLYGWNVKGLCFLVYFYFVVSLAQLVVKPLDRFWQVVPQNPCFWVSWIPRGIKIQGFRFPLFCPKTPEK